MPLLKRRYPLLSSPLLIVGVALVVRFAVLATLHTYQLSPPGGFKPGCTAELPRCFVGWQFAYEAGFIARWLTLGYGFASPYLLNPTPTAQVAPVYPLLMAGVFKLFGIYTNASAFAMFALDCISSALVCLPIFYIARNMFGPAVAVWSAWIWALLPHSIYWATHFMWYTNLSTLMLASIFLLTLRMQGSTRTFQWFGLGVFWSLILLTNPSIGSFMPVSLAWLAYKLRPRYRATVALLAVTALGFSLGMAPWVIRNYRAFGSLVLFRTDIGEELWAGNHEGGNGLYWMVKPWDAGELRRLGELGYMAQRRHNALQFIRAHPDQFAVFTLKRIGFFWWDIPEPGSLVPNYNHFFPHVALGMNARHALYFGFALLAFWGLWTAFRNNVTGTFLFAGLFFFYPLVYYVTHSHPRYQLPLVPEMLILAVYVLHNSAHQPSHLATWLSARRHAPSAAAGA